MENIVPQETPDNNSPLKRCCMCPKENQWHPATTEFFGRDKSEKDGMCRVCKKCKSAYYKAYTKTSHYREYLKTYRSQSEVQERLKTQKKAYRTSAKGHETEDAYRKKYESRAEIRERRKVWNKRASDIYMSQPENREQRRTYYRSQKIQDQKRAYRTSPEGRAVHRANSHRRIARKKAVQGTYTPEQIQDLLKRQKHKCYYCSTKFKKEEGEYVYHIDHTFPLSRVAGTDIPANSIDYLVLACPFCNQSKNDKFPWEFPEGGRLL